MRCAHCVLLISLVLGLGPCIGCGSSDTGMKNMKMSSVPSKAFPGPMKSKDGKHIKEMPRGPDFLPEPPPLRK